MMQDVKGPGFVKFLYNQNPFYLISAAVILYGFRVSIEDASVAANPWVLAGMFAAYATLLALTAWLIVRFGKVWDDARSIFMVLLLLFMALSASMDGVFAADPQQALSLAGAGFAFAVIITEALVGSLGIRFRALFRMPLYGMLAISFFYPYLFSIQKSHWPELDSRFVILLFPFVVALSILSLIPSIRKTKTYATENGTPWRWPLYPYSVFVLAIVGLIGRTVMMGLSFDASAANGMVGTWMFVPIFLAVIWVLYEIGAAEEDKELQSLAMVLMPISIALAISWPLFSNTAFYDQITLAYGSPVWMTLLAVIAIYFVAWLNSVPGVSTLLTMAMAAAAILMPNGDFVSGFSTVQAWPCLVLAVWSIASWERVRQSGRWLLASCCISVPLANIATPWLANSFEAFSSVAGNEFVVAANILLLLVCGIAGLFRDRFALQLKVMLAMALPTVAMMVAIGSLFRADASTAAAIYGCVLASVGLAVAILAKSRLHFSAAAVSIGASIFAVLPLMRFSMGAANGRLAGFIGVGMACFMAGLFVSAIKAGWTSGFHSGFDKMKAEFREAFPAIEEPIVAEHSGEITH